MDFHTFFVFFPGAVSGRLFVMIFGDLGGPWDSLCEPFGLHNRPKALPEGYRKITQKTHPQSHQKAPTNGYYSVPYLVPKLTFSPSWDKRCLLSPAASQKLLLERFLSHICGLFCSASGRSYKHGGHSTLQTTWTWMGFSGQCTRTFAFLPKNGGHSSL